MKIKVHGDRIVRVVTDGRSPDRREPEVTRDEVVEAVLSLRDKFRAADSVQTTKVVNLRAIHRKFWGRAN